MFLDPIDITPESNPRELVRRHLRAAAVLNAYGIEYCCAAQGTLQMACRVKGIEPDQLLRDLQEACRVIQVPVDISYQDWNTDFLADYIVHVYHLSLRKSLPSIEAALEKFTQEHRKKYAYFEEVLDKFRALRAAMLEHITQEEEHIFPYLRQVAHAYAERDSDELAGLLVRTLRKPLKSLVENEHRLLEDSIFQFRLLTANYEPPGNACPAHRVILARLRELDNDLVQHFYLENRVLIPRIIEMEGELLKGNL